MGDREVYGSRLVLINHPPPSCKNVGLITYSMPFSLLHSLAREITINRDPLSTFFQRSNFITYNMDMLVQCLPLFTVYTRMNSEFEYYLYPDTCMFSRR